MELEMELELTKFLHAHEDWADILRKEPYCLSIKEKGDYILFKYNQFNSDMWLAICREARGIIYDRKTLQPVCIPFFKFFNVGEPQSAVIDWNSARVEEKVDGYLVKVWYHNGWHLSSNGMIDAFDAVINSDGMSVGQLFERAVKSTFNDWIEALNPARSWTYMFEVVNPDYDVTIHYKRAGIYLLGARYRPTLREMSGRDALVLFTGCPSTLHVPELYSFKDKAQIEEFNKSYKGTDLEGFVVVDNYFNRIKMKNQSYLSVFHAIALKAKFTPKLFCYFYKDGTLDDCLAVNPDWREIAAKYFSALNKLVEEYERAYIDNEIYKIPPAGIVSYLSKNPVCPPSYVFGRLKGTFEFPFDWYNTMTEATMRRILNNCLGREE